MSSFPLPTLAAKVSATGISAPAFEDIINSKIATYQGIYGSDVELTPDTQDFQAIAAESAAINDANQLAIAVYNSFLPGSAQGAGLSAIVQINGLQRESPTNSTCPVIISGVVGTVIPLGVIRDANGNLWNIPADTEILEPGDVTVTATAQQPGAIAAAPGALSTPFTIVGGWQSVTNAVAATPGAPVETDAALRRRQAKSTALPSQSPLSSILSAVANSGGIGRFTIYENQSNVTDGNGIPGHSIAVVVEGGDTTAIASVIELKKAPGTGTFGTTNITVADPKGLPITINFFELTEVPIFAAITIQPLPGYVARPVRQRCKPRGLPQCARHRRGSVHQLAAWRRRPEWHVSRSQLRDHVADHRSFSAALLPGPTSRLHSPLRRTAPRVTSFSRHSKDAR